MLTATLGIAILELTTPSRASPLQPSALPTPTGLCLHQSTRKPPVSEILSSSEKVHRGDHLRLPEIENLIRGVQSVYYTLDRSHYPPLSRGDPFASRFGLRRAGIGRGLICPLLTATAKVRRRRSPSHSILCWRSTDNLQVLASIQSKRVGVGTSTAQDGGPRGALSLCERHTVTLRGTLPPRVYRGYVKSFLASAVYLSNLCKIAFPRDRIIILCLRWLAP